MVLNAFYNFSYSIVSALFGMKAFSTIGKLLLLYLQYAPLSAEGLLTNRARLRVFATTVSAVLRVPEIFQVQKLAVFLPEFVKRDRLV